MVMGELVFGWGVCPRGYRWMNIKPTTEPSSTSELALGPIDEVQPDWPHPEAAPALFRAFGDVRPDEDNILAFASRYGSLGSGEEVAHAWLDEAPSGLHVPVDRLSSWQAQIADMRLLVALWDHLQTASRDELESFIRWRRRGAKEVEVLFTHRGRTRVIASAEDDPELFASFTVGDPVMPAWAYLSQELHGHVTKEANQLSTTMTWDPDQERSALRIKAPTLASAVWLQFADAISNSRIFGQCKECGTWFAVAPGEARSHRRYCSNSCRTKAYKERQDRARQLFMAGNSFEQIADQLESDAKTVRRWITGSKE